PFHNKHFFLTTTFESEAQSSWLHYARTLIKVGGGIEVANPGEADIVLKGSKEKSVYPCVTVDWLQFVGMIPHPAVSKSGTGQQSGAGRTQSLKRQGHGGGGASVGRSKTTTSGGRSQQGGSNGPPLGKRSSLKR
ncbi:hypothetical protein HDU93_005499, partial [Gonapodya sp. JEL0774]